VVFSFVFVPQPCHKTRAKTKAKSVKLFFIISFVYLDSN
jgi:hypothetical protein